MNFGISSLQRSLTRNYIFAAPWRPWAIWLHRELFVGKYLQKSYNYSENKVNFPLCFICFITRYIFRIPRAVFSVREFLRNYKKNPLPPNFSIANKFSYTLYNEKISYNQTILTPPPPPPFYDHFPLWVSKIGSYLIESQTLRNYFLSLHIREKFRNF